MRLDLRPGLASFPTIQRLVGAGSGGLPPVGPVVDYVITNDADWVTMMGLPASTLSGKTAEVRGALGGVTLENKEMTTPLTIRGGVGGSIRRVFMNGSVNRVIFNSVPFQMTGWPAVNSELVYFNNGTFDNLTFRDCSFRHGYGAGLANFDMTAQLPEYSRIDNIRTATTTSTTTALTWNDPAQTEGWIEFFNRGSQTVYVAVGGSGVVATTGSTSCAAGARLRISDLNPTTATHIAILAASGTPQVNARTEIGLSAYLASPFAASGAANIGRIELVGNTFRDVNNGIKGLGRPGTIIADGNDFDRVYQDLIAVAPSGVGYFTRNILCVPFSRSGIAENLSGDARDPHGDLFQMFSDGSGPIGPVYTAGNRVRRSGGRRAGVNHQGIFYSDNDINPSYDRIYAISNTLIGGSTNGISSGEAGYPVRDMFVYGATIIDPADVAGGASAVRLLTADDARASIQSVVAQNFIEEAPGDGFTLTKSVQVNQTASPAALFPNLGQLATAFTRAEIETALTTSAEAAGLGAVATSNAIDWITTDPTQVILWDNVPSGVAWEPLNSQTIGAVITLPLRRVLNRKPNQPITPGSGVSWRSYASDGVTLVQDWTTGGGLVQPDQWVQIRGTSSTSGITTVAFPVTINGFVEAVDVTTVAAAPTVFHTQSGTGPVFIDPVNGVPANTTRMEWDMNLYATGNPAATTRLFAQSSTGCDLIVLTSGLLQVVVRDGAGVAVVSAQNASSPLLINQWQRLQFDANHLTGTATVRSNGNLIGSWAWTPTANPFFQTVRRISMLGNSSGAALLPSGWRVEYAECYFTTGGVRSLRKRIEGNAVAVNADAWKLGGDAA